MRGSMGQVGGLQWNEINYFFNFPFTNADKNVPSRLKAFIGVRNITHKKEISLSKILNILVL
jgi:hypothetical protein